MNKFFQYRQLRYMIFAYSKELSREPGVLFWGIIFPILMSLGLGIAFTKKPDIERTVALVSDSTTDSSPIISYLKEYGDRHSPEDGDTPDYHIKLKSEHLGNTTLIFRKMTWNEAMVQLKRGTLGLIVSDKTGEIRYHFDPSNSEAELTYRKVSSILNKKRAPAEMQNPNVEPLTITGTRYIDFLIPGLITMGVMTSCLWGLGYNLIDKRAKKLMRRMVATPMRKSHFLFSLITVRIVMNLIESALLFLFAWMVFDVTIQGNLAALMAVFLAGNLAFSGIAIFISSRTANTEIGNGLINVMVFPLMVLSGIFFSYHNFPDPLIPYIKLLPLTLMTDGIRSIFIEGAGFSAVWLPLILLLVMGFVFFIAGLKIFKWY